MAPDLVAAIRKLLKRKIKLNTLGLSNTKIQSKQYILSHEPIYWDNNVYGHIHDKPQEPDNLGCCCICMERTNYKLLGLGELVFFITLMKRDTLEWEGELAYYLLKKISITPGDTWEQYSPVFKANGFYKIRSEVDRSN